jgi:prepilin-type N-terminal cleavage/methylation domain-containing protein
MEDRKMLQTRLNRSRRGAHGQRGFTLIELMISLLLMGLIMTVVYKVFSSQDRFFRNQEQIASMQENLRATMEYVNQEMSWLGYRVPGLAVIKASPLEIIFQANIPNSGTTIQFVRYQFSPSTNTISRAAGANMSALANSLTVMASDIEAMSFSYYNILNGEVITDAADPLCANVLTPLATVLCNPGTTDNDASLLMVQRVKARVTARTSKPDWAYTDPNGGSNPNFRKRRAILDLRARNIEDVTLQGGEIVVGSCGYLTHSINVPTPYAACADREYDKTSGGPDPANNTFDDNPTVTIQAYDLDGNANTNPLMKISVSAVGDDGIIYDIYDDTVTINNRWEYDETGETRYIAANHLSKVSTGTEVELRLAYSDGYCTQVTYEGNTPIIIAANPASVFQTSASLPGGLSVDYVDNSGSPITVLATPGKVAMCSSVGNERVILGAQLIDDCGNGIPGETIAWSDGGFGGSFVNETFNVDGIYNATFVPPDSMGTVDSVYTATLSAQWGSFTPNVDVDFVAAGPYDIVIDSIEDVTMAGIFNFSQIVPDRATQLGGEHREQFHHRAYRRPGGHGQVPHRGRLRQLGFRPELQHHRGLDHRGSVALEYLSRRELQLCVGIRYRLRPGNK